MQDGMRVIVIGLDGATWNILEPLVQQGKLPTIGRIMQEGCYGNLESSIPHSTFPAWKCYSTGKNPGKLGVYWFLDADMGNHTVVVHNSTSFKSKEVWDILGENGIVCGVLDMPTTYPPKNMGDGIMVAYDPPQPTGFTYPRELEKTLKKQFNYKTEPDYYFGGGEDAIVSDAQNIMRQRFDVARYLIKEHNPAFFHLTIFHIDPIQHFYEGKPLEDSWALIDNGIKGLLDEFYDDNTYVLLMSDHGQTEEKCRFQVGRWLIDRNLLVLKKRRMVQRTLFNRLGLSRKNIFSLIARTGMIHLVRRYIPRNIRTRIMAYLPVESHMVEQNPMGGMIDWARSRVIPVARGALYINRALFGSQQEYETFREGIIDELERLEEPRSGAKLASQVSRREDIYHGPYLHLAPDIVIQTNEGYMVGNSPGASETWSYHGQRWHRTHRLQGIFLALGPDIKGGFEIQGAKIYDLAPTILHIFGIPIPQDIDGRVLKEVFEENSPPARREIAFSETSEKTRVKDRIKTLKNLDKI